MTATEEPEILEAVQTLEQKIVETALEVGAIEKAGYNERQKYAFVRGDDVIAAVRKELLKRHVLLLAGLKSIEERQRPTSQGGETTISTLNVEFIFHDADTGAQLALPWAGRGEDPGDKGLGKAFTNALKTYLRQQLMIPWGHEDPEADTSSDDRVGDGSVNLIAAVKGEGAHLPDSKLNEILVGAGLPAAQKPFIEFMRIPSEKAEIVSKLIAGAKSS